MVEITDVVCPLCGCVCDDIVAEVEDNEGDTGGSEGVKRKTRRLKGG